MVKEKLSATRAGTDGKTGKMEGPSVKAGSVAYADGKVSVTYKKGLTPIKPEGIEATYRYEGTLSSALNLHGNHAYIFRGVQDGKLLFHNPWGPAAYKHPQPVGPADFVKFFETVGVNAPPDRRRR